MSDIQELLALGRHDALILDFRAGGFVRIRIPSRFSMVTSIPRELCTVFPMPRLRITPTMVVPSPRELCMVVPTEECPICMQECQESQRTVMACCRQTICTACLERTCELQSRSCPFCRAPVVCSENARGLGANALPRDDEEVYTLVARLYNLLALERGLAGLAFS